MTEPNDDFNERLAELDALLEHAERSLSGPALDTARRLVSAVLAIHRESLRTLITELCSLPQGRELFHAVAARARVAGLLALHELHPEPLPARVRRAVEEADVAAGKASACEVKAIEGDTVLVTVHARTPAALALTEKLLEAGLAAYAPEARLTVDASLLDPAPPADQLISVSRLKGATRKELA